jgi:hypothetical protein
MSNPLLQKNFTAGGAIAAHTIVKFSSSDTVVVAAAAATDLLIGVCNEVGPASGERCDVIMAGIAYVKAGAAVTRGTLLTADSSGRAVTAAPAGGVNNNVIGRALESCANADEIIRVLIGPGSVQG